MDRENAGALPSINFVVLKTEPLLRNARRTLVRPFVPFTPANPARREPAYDASIR
jgi:hypothetical protein